MTNSSDQSRFDRELDWLAFRYSTGEMNADETGEFESRLASEQEACEAVARAVELAEVTAMASRRPVVEVRRSRGTNADWSRRMVWMVCGAAAGLLLMVVARSIEWKGSAAVAFSRLENKPSDQQSVTDAGLPEGSPELALAWVQARSSASAVELVGIGSGLPHDEPGLDGAGLTEITAPSWMLAALEGLSVGPDVDEIQ